MVRHLIFILACALSVCACSPQPVLDSEIAVKEHKNLKYPIKYDPYFRKYSKRYMPEVDWLLLKAQCYQESRLNPNAESPVGAKGLCQFMPNTWNHYESVVGIFGSPYEPKINIEMASYYMSSLRGEWTTKRPEKDRHSLALASYNAGLGNILEAQKTCGMPVLYRDIIKCLPEVTGKHSKETMNYVPLVYKWYEDMR